MGKNKNIRAAVEAELNFDPLVDATNIEVGSLGGDVALNGTVGTYPQYLQAALAARRVGGVKRLHNHLKVLLSANDFRDDQLLATAANNALAADVSVPAGVEATAKDGNLTLRGAVGYGSQRAAASAAVSRLYGVRGVESEIMVWSEAEPVDVQLSVQGALDRHALVWDDSDVTVDTDLNTVTLFGNVRTWAEHDAVISAAWMTDGVFDVRDELVITG